MSRVHSLILLGAGVGALLATPAAAVDLTFNLSTKSTAGLTGVAGGLTFGSTTAGNSTSVTATAYNAVRSTTQPTMYTISATNIGAYSGGLGVTSPDDYAGAYGLHQIDNAGGQTGPTSIDFVLLTFSQAVTLTGLSRNAYGIDTQGWDNDYTVGYNAIRTNLTQTTAGLLPFAKLNDFYGTSCQTFTTGTCADTDSPLGATAASTTWIVAASFVSNYGGDGKVDGFKLASVNVSYVAPLPPTPIGSVPEPATWGTMILGFGVIGSTLRRRRRDQAALAA